MIKIENDCYDCPRPCAGCGRNHMEVRICDDCCKEYAEYVVDGDDLCEDCFRKRLKGELQEMLDDVDREHYLTLQETAELLDHDVEVLQ